MSNGNSLGHKPPSPSKAGSESRIWRWLAPVLSLALLVLAAAPLVLYRT